MIIRETQIETFRRAGEATYAKSATDHMARYDPVLSAAAGRDGCERAAAKALEGARAADLASGPALQLYLELTMSLGCEFPTDPQYRWLKPFLERRQDMGAVERARYLHFHVTAYFDRAYGRENELARAALRRAHDRLTRLAAVPQVVAATALLQWLHPERLDFVDQEAASDLLGEASRAAERAHLPLPNAANVFLVLMFLFGHEIASDPLYPWVAEAITTPEPLNRLVEGACRHIAALLSATGKEGADERSRTAG